MSKVLMTFAVVLMAVACSRPSAPPIDTRPAPVAEPWTTVAEPEPASPPVPVRDELVAYTLDAMLDVAPISRQVRAGEPEDAARARYAEIASQVAEVARRDGAEAFPSAPADIAQAHFALVLVAIAAHETGFLLPLDGDSSGCTVALGGCDSGWAHSLWQVHARAGKDRAYYLAFASSIAARSLAETGGLCQYSGSCGVSRATRDIEAIYRARWAAKPWGKP